MVERSQFLGVEAILASPRMRELMQQVRKAALSAEAVLVVGEPGAGKEIIARAVHQYSDRRPGPFVDLNCAAMPRELMASELFGYERGAVAGASAAKPGLLELAHAGSLYLDEIGAMEADIQRKLKRALESGSFHRLGAVRQSRANVRVIAATAPSSSQTAVEVELLDRARTIELVVPPLRERPEDIEALAGHFLAQQNPEMRLAADAMMALYSYQWPGNVRELRNTVLRSALLAKGPLLHADDLLFTPRQIEAPTTGVTGLEPALIRRALVDHGGHRQRTADALGISRWTLARRMRDYGIAEITAGGRKQG